MKIEIRNTFHNTTAIIYTKNDRLVEDKDSIAYTLSEFQTEHVWKKLCGIKDCKCGVAQLHVDNSREITINSRKNIQIILEKVNA